MQPESPRLDEKQKEIARAAICRIFADKDRSTVKVVAALKLAGTNDTVIATWCDKEGYSGNTLLLKIKDDNTVDENFGYGDIDIGVCSGILEVSQIVPSSLAYFRLSLHESQCTNQFDLACSGPRYPGNPAIRWFYFTHEGIYKGSSYNPERRSSSKRRVSDGCTIL